MKDGHGRDSKCVDCSVTPAGAPPVVLGDKSSAPGMELSQFVFCLDGKTRCTPCRGGQEQ